MSCDGTCHRVGDDQDKKATLRGGGDGLAERNDGGPQCQTLLGAGGLAGGGSYAGGKGVSRCAKDSGTFLQQP